MSLQTLIRVVGAGFVIVALSCASSGQALTTKTAQKGPNAPQVHMRSVSNAQRKAAAQRAAQRRMLAAAQGKTVVPAQRTGVKK